MTHRLSADGALRSFMTSEQQRCFDAYRHFFVVTRAGTVFALCDGWQVIQMLDGRADVSFHVGATTYSGHRLSNRDSMLAQMLMLQTNWEELIRLACHNAPLGYYREGCPPMVGYRVQGFKPAPWYPRRASLIGRGEF